MWISEQESEVVSATLYPKMQETKKEHEDLLFEAVTLEVCSAARLSVPVCCAASIAYAHVQKETYLHCFELNLHMAELVSLHCLLAAPRQPAQSHLSWPQ